MAESETKESAVFKPVSPRVSFPRMEEEVLAFWKETDILRRIDQAREGAPLFTLYEGPPTANGAPGIHHVLARVFKDVIPRYKTMKGYRPVRKGGWDTHGLPVELEIEKELGISTKGEIEEYGIEKFNALCRASVMRYVQEWETLTDRIGFLVDMDDPYVTFTNDYIESGWWILKQLWDNELLYQGYRVAPHCPRCVTTLSSHEVALGYKEDTPDPSVYVSFPLDAAKSTQHNPDFIQQLPEGQTITFLAWTTTPWTLTANAALAVAPEAKYVLTRLHQDNSRLILAEERLKAVITDEYDVQGTFLGKELEGLYYQPLYPNPDSNDAGAYKVVTAGFVSMEDGTGIVHTAPAYGAEDMELGRAHDLPTVHTVDLQGHLYPGRLPGAGKFVKDADEDILRDLEQRGLLYKRGIYRHTYPFCWRCDTPLLYYAKYSWYIRTTAKQQALVSGNQQINWYPEHIKDGRFGEWLRNNIDWALSRERYWGTPLPIWHCESCDVYDCFGSVAELKERALGEHRESLGIENFDLHRPYIDAVLVSCRNCNGAMSRAPHVLDAWFDSGAMPYAQHHVTSLSDLQGLRDGHLFPADYICEAIDQTRGWFYTLHALATLVADEPSYRNVICLGHILDNKGEKMSKSKGNVVEPWEVINAHGADAVRWYMYTAAPPGNSRRFSADLVSESVRRFMLTLWNVYSFFVTYANLDGYNPAQAHETQPASDLDRWIRSELEQLTAEVTRLMDEYNATDAGRRIQEFVEVLSNWYVRRSRRRFWKSENDDDKASAYATLYECLSRLSKLLAPFTPFVAEEIYRNLVVSLDQSAPDSVHLAGFPVADESLIDKELSEGMRLAMRVSSLGRAARSKAKIRVRQPLAKVLVKPRSSTESEALKNLESHVIDELNVKEVIPFQDEGDVVEFTVKPNLQLLGPKLGPELPKLQKLLGAADSLQIAGLVNSNRQVRLNGYSLEPGELLVETSDKKGYASAMEAGYLVAIDTNLTPDLANEGMTRELVHLVQNMRRSAGFHIADRIVTWYQGNDRIARVMEKHGGYIKEETLSLDLQPGKAEDGAYVEDHRIDGAAVTLGVKRAS